DHAAATERGGNDTSPRPVRPTTRIPTRRTPLPVRWPTSASTDLSSGVRPYPRHENACSTTDTDAARNHNQAPGTTAAAGNPSPLDQRSPPTRAGPGDQPFSTGPDGPGRVRRNDSNAHTRAPPTR